MKQISPEKVTAAMAETKPIAYFTAKGAINRLTKERDKWQFVTIAMLTQQFNASNMYRCKKYDQVVRALKAVATNGIGRQVYMFDNEMALHLWVVEILKGRAGPEEAAVGVRATRICPPQVEQEVANLVNLGYAKVHKVPHPNMVARIDRDDWLEHMAEKLGHGDLTNGISQLLYDGQAAVAQRYREEFSTCMRHVPKAVWEAMPATGSCRNRYVDPNEFRTADYNAVTDDPCNGVYLVQCKDCGEDEEC